MYSFLAFLLAAFSACYVWIGIAFTTGELLPNTLIKVYEMFPNTIVRVAIALVPVFFIANVTSAYAMRFSPVVGGLTFVIFGAIAPLTLAIFASGTKPNLEIYVAITAIIICCIWLNTAIGRA